MEERETWMSPEVVVPEFVRLNGHWDPRTADLIRLAAMDSTVDRIFVNPVVKQELCKAHRGAPWMSRVRAYWFHEDHLHVRLKCPPGSPQCRGQEPVPSGDGCGDLAGWFTPDRRRESRRQRETASTPRMPGLPGACGAVLAE